MQVKTRVLVGSRIRAQSFPTVVSTLHSSLAQPALSFSRHQPTSLRSQSEAREQEANMSGEEPVAAAAAEATPAPALGEPMDIMTALQLVLRKSLAHGGLARGLHEGAKVIEKHAAVLCVLAEDCDQPDYVKLVKALCADHNVNLITVPAAKTLGEWAGVSKNLLNCF
ncbi:OLC1v1014587C2 [Oldenlandia corymbosa var. corymbosa]|uniref:40S ribosomal protein S12 n=1 Tax=Oldenlandia corymbosa var. corymbosa TaxID=529605 RepID=A0AAV1E103_OLDCO|nr:OLC1v1014587C2 [Oldenlandia corymbosa var. corymbosa]